ncbi:hypothetical protein CLD22_16790 [Rubrivivax gelatinosus]|nr:hypothetical protein [Rubrivivax gelatinosus]
MDKRFAEAIRRAGYRSMDSLARELKVQAPEAFDGIEPRSLGAKLGDLARGVSTWWRGRTDGIEALKKLIEFDAGELVKALEQQARGRWSFPEFRALMPLDLLEELPADLGAFFPADPKASALALEAWIERALPPVRRHARPYTLSGLTWLTVPPGCGRGLLLARLQAVGSVDVVAADTLEEAVAMASGGRPLVLAPRRAVLQDDMEALIRLAPARPVLVVTADACPRPTPPPEAAWHPRWEWLNSDDSARRRLDLVKGNQGGAYGFGELGIFEWRLAPDWRLRLIAWLEQRLEATGDTLFSRQGLAGWLQRFDPTSVWFSTPADVIALASLCHASGERKLPSPESADAGARLLHHLAPMDSRTGSLLLRLVTVRWRDAGHEWLAPLPWDHWQDLADAQSNVCDGEGSTARKKRAPTLDLEALRKEGFLVADSRGWWAFAQPVQARLVLRDALMRWVSQGDLDHWARPLVGDSSRQAALDSVLAAMPRNALDRSIKAVQQAAKGSLSALSAAEALFIALGRKFASGLATYAPELAELHALILQQHREACGYVSPPFTRPEGEGCGVPLSWLLACWEWSLCAPPPAALPPELVDWYPGWRAHGDDANWAWYSQLPQSLLGEGGGDDEVRTGFDEAVQSALRVVDRVGCQGLLGFVQTGPLWAVLMLVAAGRGQTVPEAAWWHELFRWRKAPDHLVRSLEREDADVIATRLLPSFIEAASGPNSLSSVLALLGPTWTWLFRRSAASKVLPGLPAATVSALYRRYRGLPPGWREALADRLGPHEPEWCWEAVLTDSANPEALVDRLLSAGLLSVALTMTLWKLAPAQCLAHASDPQRPMSSILIAFCPSEYCGLLAQEMARRDDLLPDRAQRLGWVLQHLRESRGQGVGLRALLDRLELR